MVNKIKKTCPTCGNEDADILCAIKERTPKGEMISYNIYKCIVAPRHRSHQFKVKRKGNREEQELTEKYINSSKIKLD